MTFWLFFSSRIENQDKKEEIKHSAEETQKNLQNKFKNYKNLVLCSSFFPSLLSSATLSDHFSVDKMGALDKRHKQQTKHLVEKYELLLKKRQAVRILVVFPETKQTKPQQPQTRSLRKSHHLFSLQMKGTTEKEDAEEDEMDEYPFFFFQSFVNLIFSNTPHTQNV